MVDWNDCLLEVRADVIAFWIVPIKELSCQNRPRYSLMVSYFQIFHEVPSALNRQDVAVEAENQSARIGELKRRELVLTWL